MVEGIARGAAMALSVMLMCGSDTMEGQNEAQGPPGNLEAGAYRTVVRDMWRDSPTFRRQCKVLADAPWLTVKIRGESGPSVSGVRARTEISITPGRAALASIVLMSPADTVELIAHEIEHVVEALEGVRLTEHGCKGNSMGRAVESCRAVETGRQVATEVHAARQQRVRLTARVPVSSSMTGSR
jgi:hypothetical protein